MQIELNEQEVNILKALIAGVYDSNIGREVLEGWPSTSDMSDEEINESFDSLASKIK